MNGSKRCSEFSIGEIATAPVEKGQGITVLAFSSPPLSFLPDWPRARACRIRPAKVSSWNAILGLSALLLQAIGAVPRGRGLHGPGASLAAGGTKVAFALYGGFRADSLARPGKVLRHRGATFRTPSALPPEVRSAKP